MVSILHLSSRTSTEQPQRETDRELGFGHGLGFGKPTDGEFSQLTAYIYPISYSSPTTVHENVMVGTENTESGDFTTVASGRVGAFIRVFHEPSFMIQLHLISGSHKETDNTLRRHKRKLGGDWGKTTPNNEAHSTRASYSLLYWLDDH